MDLAAEADLHSIILARVQPDIAHLEPVVREFHLPAVDDLLAEDAELIADGKARDRIAQARRRVHIARGEPPETAVAETGIRLERTQTLEAEAKLVQDLPCRLQKAHVEQVVAQARADQKLHRHVVDLLVFLRAGLLDERAALILQKLPDCHADSAVDLLFRGHFQRAAKHTVAAFLQMLQKVLFCH